MISRETQRKGPPTSHEIYTIRCAHNISNGQPASNEQCAPEAEISQHFHVIRLSTNHSGRRWWHARIFPVFPIGEAARPHQPVTDLPPSATQNKSSLATCKTALTTAHRTLMAASGSHRPQAHRHRRWPRRSMARPTHNLAGLHGDTFARTDTMGSGGHGHSPDGDGPPDNPYGDTGTMDTDGSHRKWPGGRHGGKGDIHHPPSLPPDGVTATNPRGLIQTRHVHPAARPCPDTLVRLRARAHDGYPPPTLDARPQQPHARTGPVRPPITPWRSSRACTRAHTSGARSVGRPHTYISEHQTKKVTFFLALLFRACLLTVKSMLPT